MALAGGLAETRTTAATKAFLGLPLLGEGIEFVQLHYS
jgi:hypothetical protein